MCLQPPVLENVSEWPSREKDIQFYQKPGDMSNKTRALHRAAAWRKCLAAASPAAPRACPRSVLPISGVFWYYFKKHRETDNKDSCISKGEQEYGTESQQQIDGLDEQGDSARDPGECAVHVAACHGKRP
jgi:hypothetical protein